MDLNNMQRAVLQWVADGSPDGVMEGYAHRVSASALRSRGLVVITGRGPTWHAEITEAGRAKLAAVSSHSAQPSGEETVEEEERPPAAGARAPAAGRTAQRLSKTEQLVADLIAAGGTLRLPDHAGHGGVNWRQRAYAAQRHGKVPAGKHLSVSRSADAFEIRLMDGETGNELGAEAVHVPARVARYHSVARQFRERSDLQEISRKSLPRALRIVHALALELERRGHETALVRVDRDYYGRTDSKPKKEGQIVVTARGHDIRVRIYEQGCDLRGPWEERLRKREEDRKALRFDRWDVGRITPTTSRPPAGSSSRCSSTQAAKRPGVTDNAGRWRIVFRRHCARSRPWPTKPSSAASRASGKRPSASGAGSRRWCVPASSRSSTTGSRSCASVWPAGMRLNGFAPTAAPSKSGTVRPGRATKRACGSG